MHTLVDYAVQHGVSVENKSITRNVTNNAMIIIIALNKTIYSGSGIQSLRMTFTIGSDSVKYIAAPINGTT